MYLHKNIHFFTWFNFFSEFRPYAVIAILYFSNVTGSFALGMLIFSFVRVSSAVFEIPTGIFSDRIGRRKTMIYGSIAGIFSVFFYAVGNSFWILVLGVLLQGLQNAFFNGNNDAFLYDTLADHNKEKSYSEFLGRTNSMLQLALALAALFGGMIADWSFNFVFWISILPQFFCLVLSFKMIEPVVHKKAPALNIYQHLFLSLQKFKENKKLRLLSLTSVLDYGIGETIHQFHPIFIALFWPLWGVGVARMMSHFFAAIGFWFSGRLIHKFHLVRLLIFGKLCNRIIAFIAYGFPSVISPFFIALPSFLFGFRTVAQNTLFQREFTHQQRATMASFNSLFGSLFFAFFAFSFGWFADRFGVIQALLFAEILLFFSIFAYWRFLQEERKSK